MNLKHFIKPLTLFLGVFSCTEKNSQLQSEKAFEYPPHHLEMSCQAKDQTLQLSIQEQTFSFPFESVETSPISQRDQRRKNLWTSLSECQSMMQSLDSSLEVHLSHLPSSPQPQHYLSLFFPARFYPDLPKEEMEQILSSWSKPHPLAYLNDFFLLHGAKVQLILISLSRDQAYLTPLLSLGEGEWMANQNQDTVTSKTQEDFEGRIKNLVHGFQIQEEDFKKIYENAQKAFFLEEKESFLPFLIHLIELKQGKKEDAVKPILFPQIHFSSQEP